MTIFEILGFTISPLIVGIFIGRINININNLYITERSKKPKHQSSRKK